MAVNTTKDEDVYAAKLEESNTKHPQLYFEAKLYKLLNQDGTDRGIPRVSQLTYRFMP